AEGSPLRLTRTWQTLRPQDKFLVIGVTQIGPAKGPLTVRVDGWQWDVVPPARAEDPVVPFVLPLEGRPEGPLVVEIVAPVGQPVQWHALGLTGPLDDGWFPLEPVKLESKGGTTFNRRADGAVLVGMPAPKRDTYTILLQGPPGGIRALRMDALLDSTLPKPACGPGTGPTGVFVMKALDVAVAAADGTRAPLEVAAAYSDPLRVPGQGPIDAVRQAANAYMPYPQWQGAPGVANSAVLHLRDERPTTGDIVVATTFSGGDNMSIGCFRFYGSADPFARLPAATVALVREATQRVIRPERSSSASRSNRSPSREALTVDRPADTGRRRRYSQVNMPSRPIPPRAPSIPPLPPPAPR
ncbi:MAG: hypothetical protein ACKOC4_00760, partial [Planctomycetia bacterium]